MKKSELDDSATLSARCTVASYLRSEGSLSGFNLAILCVRSPNVESVIDHRNPRKGSRIAGPAMVQSTQKIDARCRARRATCHGGQLPAIERESSGNQIKTVPAAYRNSLGPRCIKSERATKNGRVDCTSVKGERETEPGRDTRRDSSASVSSKIK